MLLNNAAHVGAQNVNERFGITRRGNRFLCPEASVQVRQRDGGQTRHDIDSDDPRTVGVEIEKPGPPPAGQLTEVSFRHPALADQLIHNQ